MSSGRPAWSGVKGARNYGSEFVGADGRRALGWLRVVGDDRHPSGTKSLSRGVPQLCVCRQRTLSRKRMVRIWLRLTRMPASLAACASAERLHWAEPRSSRATIVPSLGVAHRPGGAWLTSATSLLSSSIVSRRGRPGLGWAIGVAPSARSYATAGQWLPPALHPGLRATMRACRIPSAGPCRLAASLRTCFSSCSSCAARTRRIFGISLLLSSFGNTSSPLLSLFNERSTWYFKFFAAEPA